MDKEWVHSFREKLDQHYSWPSLYIFKFIVPHERVTELKALFPEHSITERTSAKGTYTSITMQMMMPSSSAVIEIYQRASSVEGLIAL